MNAAEVDAAIAAAIANMAITNPATAPPGPAAYARNPAQATAGVIDYRTSTGMKLYQAATAPLTTKFNMDTAGLHMFLKAAKERSQREMWQSIFNIPDGQGGMKNLFDSYGICTTEMIKAHAIGYESDQGREAQNSGQAYGFLLESLTTAAQASVQSDPSLYTLSLPDGLQVTNGPAFLKAIIRKSSIDTRSTVFHLRGEISANGLLDYMSKVSYDIELFNQFVDLQVEALMARGETTSDLLVNLFMAYLAVPDRKFVDYIEKQKDKFDEGEVMDERKLMSVALTKFKDRKRSNQWQAPSAEAEQIVALTAQVQRHNQDRRDFRNHHKAGAVRVSRPAGVKHPWSDRPTEGDAHHRQVQGGHDIRRPFQ